MMEEDTLKIYQEVVKRRQDTGWVADTPSVGDYIKTKDDAWEKAYIEDVAALHSALQREVWSRRIKQGELAKMAGMRPQQISKIFSVKGNPTLQTLHKIAFALDMKITVRRRHKGQDASGEVKS